MKSKQFTDKCLRHDIKLFASIRMENNRQLEKWGVQNHDIFTWLAFAMEEAGETSAAASELVFRKGSNMDVYNEAIQTATLFLKIAEMVMFSGNRRADGKGDK